MWWSRIGSMPDGLPGLPSPPKAFQAELQPQGGRFTACQGSQPGPAQNQHPARRWAGFQAIPAFLTPAGVLSVPGIYPPPSHETSPQDKTRPSAQLIFSSPITHEDVLPTIVGDGWWPPLLPPFSVLLMFNNPLVDIQCKCHKFVQYSVNTGLNTFLSC